MNPSAYWKWLRCSVGVFVLLACGAAVAVAYQGACPCEESTWTPTTLDDLQSLSICELEDLYRRSELGRPMTGVGEGRLLCLTDPRLPRLKVRIARTVWRGKGACEDGYFTNRWIGGVDWIDSHYVVGPSWVDGKPSVIMEYAPKTPLFENMHDELREVSPGLYFGPVYERFPCPKLRGYVGVKLKPCAKQKGCPENGCCPH